jgi:hypothetical protein
MNVIPRGKEFVGIDIKKQKPGCKPYSGKQGGRGKGGSNCRFVKNAGEILRKRNSIGRGKEREDQFVNIAQMQEM